MRVALIFFALHFSYIPSLNGSLGSCYYTGVYRNHPDSLDVDFCKTVRLQEGGPVPNSTVPARYSFMGQSCVIF